MTGTDRFLIKQTLNLLNMAALRIKEIESKQERIVQVLKKLSEDVTALKNAPKHECKCASSGTKRRGRPAKKEAEPTPESCIDS